MSAMRVDDVPPWLSPAFHAFGYGAAGALELVLKTVRRTCRIERTSGAEYEGARIECIWHEHLPAYMATSLPPRGGRTYAWMNHPIWFMRPVHIVLAWNGVPKLALGSSGHGGQQALQTIVDELRAGVSTLVAVDGPEGPVRTLKRGALDMAVASGRPIVAIRYEYEAAWRAPGWDAKRFPRPFSRVRIVESDPIFVTDETYESARARVVEALG